MFYMYKNNMYTRTYTFHFEIDRRYFIGYECKILHTTKKTGKNLRLAICLYMDTGFIFFSIKIYDIKYLYFC